MRPIPSPRRQENGICNTHGYYRSRGPATLCPLTPFRIDEADEMSFISTRSQLLCSWQPPSFFHQPQVNSVASLHTESWQMTANELTQSRFCAMKSRKYGCDDAGVSA